MKKAILSASIAAVIMAGSIGNAYAKDVYTCVFKGEFGDEIFQVEGRRAAKVMEMNPGIYCRLETAEHKKITDEYTWGE